MNDAGKGGRPKEWEDGTEKGNVLRDALIQVASENTKGDKYEVAAKIVNELLGTSYTREGIKSAAYRYDLQVGGLSKSMTRNQRIREQYNMKEDDDIPIMRLQEDRLWVPFWMTSDWHIGHKEFWEELFLYHREKAKELGAYMIGGGDLLETDVPTHMPQTMWGQNMSPSDQTDWLIAAVLDLLIAMMIPGNHEYRLINLTSMCPIKQAADEVEALYRRYGGTMVFEFDTGVEYEVCVKHGSSFARNSENEVKKWGDIYRDSDVVALGHDHQLWAKSINHHFKTITDKHGNRKRVRFEQMGMRMGHFLRYGGYVEGRPYPPSAPGSSIMWLNTQNREIKIDVVEEFGTFIDMNER